MKLRKIKTWQWIAAGLLLIVALDWAMQLPDSRARELNQLIRAQGSLQLQAYPYVFHVLRVEGETAVMATPRNAQVPALRFIRAIHPDIDVMDNNNPAFIAAEKRLGEVQSEALRIVMSQPDIKRVTWELDKKWLTKHGIDTPAQ